VGWGDGTEGKKPCCANVRTEFWSLEQIESLTPECAHLGIVLREGEGLEDLGLASLAYTVRGGGERPCLKQGRRYKLTPKACPLTCSQQELGDL
jgi:hypothetical protein